MDEGFGGSTEENLYVRLAEAIADAKGVDTLELDPLYPTIDAEAVAQVVQSADDTTGEQLQVSFAAADCDVTVTGNRTIEVMPKAAPATDD